MNNNNLLDGNAFIEKLINVFPELKEEILDEDFSGLITLQLGSFKRFTQKLIDSDDQMSLEKCFKFINDNIDNLEFRVENALYLSYLDRLNFDQNPNAKTLLPNKLKNIFNQIKNAIDLPVKNEKLKDFLNKNR